MSIKNIKDSYNSWYSAIEAVAQNDKQHSWICKNPQGKMCIVSHQEYFAQKHLLGWGRTYKKLTLSELVDHAYQKFEDYDNLLQKQFGTLQKIKTETDQFKNGVLLLKNLQQTFINKSKKTFATLQTIRDQAEHSKCQKTGFFAWVIAKIWSRWFDPKEKLHTLQTLIDNSTDVATEAFTFRACMNMQVIEKAVHGKEPNVNITSKKQVKNWFTQYHPDKLTDAQKERLEKDSVASKAHYRMTELFKLWDQVCPDNPNDSAANVDSGPETVVPADID